jgi:hypothetical protein
MSQLDSCYNMLHARMRLSICPTEARHSDHVLRAQTPSSLLEALLGRLPVDHIPDGLEVLRFTVLVLEAVIVSPWAALGNVTGDLLVSMLPSIDTKNRPELSNNGVLVLVDS